MFHPLKARNQLETDETFLISLDVFQQEGILNDILVAKIELNLVDDSFSEVFIGFNERDLFVLGTGVGFGGGVASWGNKEDSVVIGPFYKLPFSYTARVQTFFFINI